MLLSFYEYLNCRFTTRQYRLYMLKSGILVNPLLLVGMIPPLALTLNGFTQ